MNKTSFTEIFLFFFLLVGVEHINASSTNLRKRKTTPTTTSLIDALSSIFMKDGWTCDETNEPSPVPTVTVDVPTSSTISPTSLTLSVTNTPKPNPTPTMSDTTLRPTSIPTTSPTYTEKKLPVSDDTFGLGISCSMSNELIAIGEIASTAYLYHLNGNEVSKFTEDDDYFGHSISIDEKVVVGINNNYYVKIFSLEGIYEETIICDDCQIFGRAVATYGDRIVISGLDSSNKLFIYTTEGKLLKTIYSGDDWIHWIHDVDISDEVVVFTTKSKSLVYNNTAPNFEFIAEIPQGGYVVATSGDRVVIGDYRTNNYDGAAWLYSTDGTFIRTLEHESQRFGWSVDITDEKIIVGADGDNEVDTSSGAVFIYSAATGEFQEKVFAPDGQAGDHFGSCVSASDSYFVVGARDADVHGSFFSSGAAYLFSLSDDVVIGQLLSTE